MVNSWAVCGCCTRTDIVREHLEDTLRICDVSARVYRLSHDNDINEALRSLMCFRAGQR
jgi:hypothetical protein